MDTSQVIKLATEIALITYEEMQSPETTYISAKKAKQKYHGLLELWERSRFVTSIPSDNGKFRLYPAKRLEKLHQLYTLGKI